MSQILNSDLVTSQVIALMEVPFQEKRRMITEGILVADLRTYKKWFARLSNEKASIEIEIERLNKTNTINIDKIKEAIPLLTNIKEVYDKLWYRGKA